MQLLSTFVSLDLDPVYTGWNPKLPDPAEMHQIYIFYHGVYTTWEVVYFLVCYPSTFGSSYENGPKRVEIADPKVYGYARPRVDTRHIHTNFYPDGFESDRTTGVAM